MHLKISHVDLRKGELQTFWLKTRTHLNKGNSSNDSSESSLDDSEDNKNQTSSENQARANYPDLAAMDDRTTRLVNWNCEMFLKLLRQITSSRQALGVVACDKPVLTKQGGTVIDEVAEIVNMKSFDAAMAANRADPGRVDLGQEVEEELRDYVRTSEWLTHSLAWRIAVPSLCC